MVDAFFCRIAKATLTHFTVFLGVKSVPVRLRHIAVRLGVMQINYVALVNHFVQPEEKFLYTVDSNVDKQIRIIFFI